MVCRECGDEVDALVATKVDGKRRKLCEDCVERHVEEGEVAQLAGSAVRDMMGYKQRW